MKHVVTPKKDNRTNNLVVCTYIWDFSEWFSYFRKIPCGRSCLLAQGGHPFPLHHHRHPTLAGILPLWDQDPAKLQEWKFKSSSYCQQLSQWAEPAPDWSITLDQPIRSCRLAHWLQSWLGLQLKSFPPKESDLQACVQPGHWWSMRQPWRLYHSHCGDALCPLVPAGNCQVCPSGLHGLGQVETQKVGAKQWEARSGTNQQECFTWQEHTRKPHRIETMQNVKKRTEKCWPRKYFTS